REAAAGSFADSLVKRGQYSEAAEQVYVAYAKANPQNAKAPDALRNAIETYMLADSVARSHNDQGASRQARQRAVELSAQLAQQQTSGDTAAANRVLANACARPSEGMEAECSSRVAERSFSQGVSTFGEYQPLKLTISSKSQLTAAGVQRASREKQMLLRQL